MQQPQTHCTAPVPFSVPVSGTIFDSLQTGPDWTADTIGYNFRHHLPTARFPPGTVYFGAVRHHHVGRICGAGNLEVAVRAVPPKIGVRS